MVHDPASGLPTDIDSHVRLDGCAGHSCHCRRTYDAAGELLASLLGAAMFLALVAPWIGLVAPR